MFVDVFNNRRENRRKTKGQSKTYLTTEIRQLSSDFPRPKLFLPLDGSSSALKMAACCSRFVPARKCLCVKVQWAKNFRHCYLGLSNSCWTIFLGSSPKNFPFSHVLLHNSLKNLCWLCLVGLTALRREHPAITT